MPVTNPVKAKLDADEPVFGPWVASLSPRSAETLGAAGVDWIGIDMEHTPATATDIEAIVRGAERHDVPAIVRLSSVDHAAGGGAKRALDAGAKGLIIPRVESAEDAERAVRAARFPPQGDRGVAGSVRANNHGEQFDDYVESANDVILVIVQIETKTAVERVDEILAVDGIDVAFIGENDLSTTYGNPGEKDRPEVREAVRTIRETAAEHDIHAGIVAGEPDRIERRIDAGFRVFLLGGDLGFLREGVRSVLPG
ncbi:MAG: aldolase/citrate lyase family protein [Halobacteriales archaeon]|nr:aldolase/citrate lyase family protein [Halobacteriales archaeon]